MTTQLRNAKRLFGALATAAGIAMASTAAADPLVITIGAPTVGGFPVPYAQVTYDLVGGPNSNQATFTFTALGSYFFSAVNTVAVNTNGAASLFGAITGNAPAGVLLQRSELRQHRGCRADELHHRH